MRKIVYFFAIILIALSCFNGLLFAQKPGTTGAEFLKIPIGARQAGLGGTFVGIGDDVNSLFWNPGGLSTLNVWGFSAMHSEWLSDLRFDSFDLAFPIFGRKTVAGLMVGLLSIPSWDNTGGLEPKVNAQDFFGGFSIAHRIYSNIYLGGNIKYIHRKLANYTASALAGDLGIIYKRSNWLTVGGSVQNYGGKIQFLNSSASLPFVIRGGGSVRPYWGKTFDIILAVDGSYYINDDLKQSNLAVEFNLFHFLSLRAGYRFDNTLFSLSTGIGFRYSIFRIDYAYNPFQNKLANYSHVFSTHQISLSISSVTPIAFASYWPGPLKKTFFKKRKYYKKVNKLLENENRGMSYKKKRRILEKKNDLTNFFRKNFIFYLDSTQTIKFKWQKSIDPDPGDSVFYRIYITKIDSLPESDWQKNFKYFSSGKKLCDSKYFVNWYKFKNTQMDTVECFVFQKDSLILPQGKYAWWVEAYDLSGHRRNSKGNFRIIDIRYFKPPLLREPRDKKELEIKWNPPYHKIGENSRYHKYMNDIFNKDTPGGGIIQSYRKDKIIKRYPVKFKWRPAVLGFGRTRAFLNIYKDKFPKIPFISKVVQRGDSSIVIQMPIPNGKQKYYWQVIVENLNSNKQKKSPRWSFITFPPQIIPPADWLNLSDFINLSAKISAKLNADTLYVKQKTIRISNIPLVPIFFFDPNSIKLDRDSKYSLDTLAMALKNFPQNDPDVKLLLSAYCDRKTDPHNLKEAKKLSLQRAKVVKTALLDRNPELKNLIFISSFSGENIYQSRVVKKAETNLDNRKIEAENRRVEIKVKIAENKLLANISTFGNLIRRKKLLYSLKKILNRNPHIVGF